MLLDSEMKRATISATIGVALKGAKNDPRRSIRNTLDLFEHFTTELFDEQTMNKIRQDLENPKSYLFRLVTKTVKSVDNTLLKTVGTNLCYNRLVIFPFKEQYFISGYYLKCSKYHSGAGSKSRRLLLHNRRKRAI